VQERLKPGLELWLESLFCATSLEELSAVLAMQRQVGEVHARAEIPVNLVSRGMRVLKREINGLLLKTTLNRDDLVETVLRADHLIDIAFEVMSVAYVDYREQGIRIDESFRFFSSGHNLAMEREKQLGAVLEWENKLFRAITNDASLENLLPINYSSFGLWIRHKAPLMFGEIHELPLLDQSIKSIDESLIPQITSNIIENYQIVVKNIVKNILGNTEQIKYLLNTIFDRQLEMEIGRDALTQLYNRRFMPTILKREIELSRQKKTPFCVLMLDIDFFKKVNDTYGHDAGDRVLQHVSAVIMNRIRAGDFAFRYGGEEFLMVLTEIDLEQGKVVAEQLRERVAAKQILISNNQSLNVTISIGIAMNDGHPDYKHLIERADKALYTAKNTGRNCCQIALDS
jgi:diguanylate cyclase